MSDTSQFLNLYDLFVNQIFGHDNIAMFLAASFMIIAYLAARYRFPNQVTIAIFGVYALMMGVFFQSLLAVTLWVIGALFAWGISRMMTRG